MKSSFNQNNSEIFLAIALVVMATLSRFLPHPPNFSPVLAIGLFSGMIFRSRILALALPLSAIFLSDLVLGFYEGITFVYLSYVLVVLLGSMISSRKLSTIGLSAVGSSVLFFIFSNLGVWAFSTLYVKNLHGLIECYVMALPFFQNTLISTLLGAFVLFGAYEWVGKLVFKNVQQASMK